MSEQKSKSFDGYLMSCICRKLELSSVHWWVLRRP